MKIIRIKNLLYLNMSDVLLIQPNSSLYYLSESMCSLDVSTTIRCSAKTPSAPIVGKKIISEQLIVHLEDDKISPFQIFIKKKRQEKSPSQPPKKEKRPKLKSCSNRKNVIETKNDAKKPQKNSSAQFTETPAQQIL